MDGKYQTKNSVYDYRVTSPEPQKTYYSFNHKRYSQETTLSSYVWHLKETLDETPNLKW